MLKYSMTISQAEEDLLDAIAEIGFGEIYGLEVEQGEPSITAEVSLAQRSLIYYLRRGHQKIDILHIHQGDPVSAENDFKMGRFRCRKKTRFPTE